jgi:hypothetical protein
MRITNKRQMYRMLSDGLFGNTNPAWFDLSSWDVNKSLASVWGLRSMVPGDTRCALDVPTDMVVDRVWHDFYQGVCISPMVDDWLTFRGEVFDTPTGLMVYGLYGMKPVKWREAMSRYGVHYQGVNTRQLLKGVLNENSYDDLMILLEQYPGHVVEFTALDRCYGTVPHRNAVIWEVRFF